MNQSRPMGTMTLKQFLTLFKLVANRFQANARMRTTIGRYRHCPITAVCQKYVHRVYSPSAAHLAATWMGMSHEDASDIIDASDYPMNYLAETKSIDLRKRMLKIIREAKR